VVVTRVKVFASCSPTQIRTQLAPQQGMRIRPVPIRHLLRSRSTPGWQRPVYRRVHCFGGCVAGNIRKSLAATTNTINLETNFRSSGRKMYAERNPWT
jgi:hypothetical protein